MGKSKQGKANDPIEFREYKSNIKLCPVRTLDTYIERTQHLRREHDSTKLFISYVKPHKPVSKETTARWVSRMLELSGIDTKAFRPHSKRAASSSLAARKQHLRKYLFQTFLRWAIGQISQCGKNTTIRTQIRPKNTRRDY